MPCWRSDQPRKAVAPLVLLAAFTVIAAQDCTYPSGLGRDPFPGVPRPITSLCEWRKLVPEPHDMINGAKPPGIPAAVNSSVLQETVVDNVTFINWWIPGRAPGYRTPIHFHPRPQVVCVVSGHIMTIIDGLGNMTHGPGDCYLMPQLRKMVNIALGPEATYTDFDTFRVPYGEPEWVVVEPSALDMQGGQFARAWWNGASLTEECWPPTPPALPQHPPPVSPPSLGAPTWLGMALAIFTSLIVGTASGIIAGIAWSKRHAGGQAQGGMQTERSALVSHATGGSPVRLSAHKQT